MSATHTAPADNGQGLPAAMSLDEAASYLRISKSGLYRLLNSGRLPSVHIMRRRLIRRVDVDALLADAAQGA